MERPINLPAERGILGIIINENELIYDTGRLTAADFGESYHGELFNLLKDQVEAGRAVTSATLLHDAQDAVIWGEDLKASEYLARLEADAPPSRLLPELVRTVSDVALRARLVDASQEMTRRVLDAPVSITAAELRTQYDETFAALFSSIDDLGMRKMSDVTDAILERLKSPESVIGHSAGLVCVQDLIGTFLPGNLYLLGGSPGSGKSALTAQLLRSVARNGVPVALFSPEMGDEDQARRLMAADTGVESHRIARGMVNNTEYEQLWNAGEVARDDLFYIDAHTRPSLSIIRGRSRRKQKLGGLGMIAIDHVHYMSRPDRRMSEADAFSENLAGLKQLAKDLGIPVLGLVQFTAEALRDMARWPHRRPTQGDLLYAGAVDRHSDAVILIHRLEYFLRRNKPGPEEQHHVEWGARLMEAADKADILLAKHRDGVGYGERTAYFNAPRLHFTDGPFRTPAATDVDLLTGMS